MIAQPQYAFAPTMMAEGGLVPAARAVQSKGRNGDSMLVHMTPGEVGGLQALAMQHGGSLSINPSTGLPEAGFLKSLLPTLVGAGLNFMFPGSGALIGLGVGGVEALRTGDIGKGLLAGLGAYGGAQLAGGLMQAGTAAGATSGAVGSPSALAAEAAGNQSATETARLTAANQAAAATAAPATFSENLALAGRGAENLFTGQPGTFDEFIGTAATETAPATGLGGGVGALKTAGSLVAPALLQPPEFSVPGDTTEKSDYAGPYTPSERQVRYPTEDERRRTSEFTYFAPSNPVPFSKGGVPTLEDGGFVLTKKAVDGLGKGSNKEGQRVASAGLGAIPIKGAGAKRGPKAGVDDKIKTSIEGKRPALVSNGEAYVPKKQVAEHGGAKKFYALMKKAERRA